MKDKYKIEESLLPVGFKYPEMYVRFVADMSVENGSLNQMPPWVFASDELWALSESTDVFGINLIPFAQAEHMDMMAYFSSSNSPEVWVANPWEALVVKKFENFGLWLEFAKDVTSKFLEDKPEYQGNKFWFTDSA